MAWFQNLAGRAEDLLNKIDQNAATVLNENISNKSTDKLLSVVTSSEIDDKSNSNPESAIINVKSTENEVDNQDFIAMGIDCDRKSSVENIFEKSRHESPVSKSISSHSSFILTEEVENINEKIEKLEYENQELHKQLLDLRHLIAELRNENGNLHTQVENLNYLVTNAQSEMEQYKARAQRILQEKEQLILLNNQNKSEENSYDILVNYQNELKKELEFQQNKNVELTEKVKKMSQDISYLQQQLVATQSTSQTATQTHQESLMAEKRFRLMAEEDCRLKSQELRQKIQELTHQQGITELKNEEIKKLQEALRKKANVDSNSELKVQVQSLTDMIMLKQNTLETITTERNALKLQLEKLENEYQNSLSKLEKAQIRVINVNDTDDVKSQVPPFMRVTPFDAGVTRRVKTAYSTVDAISIRTGIFLRRYPVARVFVFCYMVLLHLWVLVILFLYVPSSR